MSAAAELLEKLGVHLDPELLVLALTHRSFAHEAGGIPTNERLEFLGDAVLGLVVTERCTARTRTCPEGALAKMRAATVSQRALAVVARDLDLGSYVLLGKGELSHRRARTRTRSCRTRSRRVFGAVYLQPRLETARSARRAAGRPVLEAAADLGAGLDWKTSLQELSAGPGPRRARATRSTARARTTPGRSPRARSSTASRVGSGVGPAKKLAEQDAAADAYRVLEPALRRLPRLTCRSCPRSRPSGTGSPGTCSVARSPASRCAATTASGGTRRAARLRRPAARAAARRGGPARQVPLAPAGRRGRRAPGAPRHERSAAGARARATASSTPTCASGSTSTTGRPGLRRPAHVRPPERPGPRPDPRRLPGRARLADCRSCPSRSRTSPATCSTPPSTATALVAAVRRRRTGIKRALLDQTVVSGIGNIYADEALWRARLHYARPTETLRRAEVERVLDGAARGDDRGARAGRDELRRALRQRQRGVGLLRPVARGVRAGGSAVPALRHAGAPRRVHEPVVVQLPALPAAARARGRF